MKELNLREEELRDSLQECLAWPQCKASHESISRFRSAALVAAACNVFPDGCHTRPEVALAKFAEFAHTRQNYLNLPLSPSSDVPAEMIRPRALLASAWTRSLFDGVAVFESAGWINEDELPPWDCWLQITPFPDNNEPLLLSWVPPSAGDEIDRAIFADAAKCMSWLHVQRSGVIALHGWGERWSGATE